VTDSIVKPVRVFLLLVAASAALLTGCEPPKGPDGKPAAPALKGVPKPIDYVDRIALLVPQRAVVNLDNQPGPDGVIAQIMLLKDFGKGPKTVLGTGEIDLLVFEGSQPDNLNNAPKPFFVKTFTAAELAKRVVGQYNTLWGYALQAKWTTPPKSSNIWMLARYRASSGPALFSSPAEQRMPSPESGAE